MTDIPQTHSPELLRDLELIRLRALNAELLAALKWAREETDRFQSDGRIDWTDFYNRVTETIDKAEQP